MFHILTCNKNRMVMLRIKTSEKNGDNFTRFHFAISIFSFRTDYLMNLRCNGCYSNIAEFLFSFISTNKKKQKLWNEATMTIYVGGSS